MIIELTPQEFEAMYNVVLRAYNYDVDIATNNPDLDDPVDCLAVDNYLEAAQAIEVLRRAR